jgi:uncharacterized protein DUF882
MKPCLPLLLLASQASAAEPPETKKELLRDLKRLPATAPRAVHEPTAAPVTFFNLKTHEALPVLDGGLPTREEWGRLLRCHFTGTVAWVDTRLAAAIVAAARKFGCGRVEVVSGYRDPKYNRMLKKKGHEVAGQSLHTRAQAVDFRLPGVPTLRLRDYLLRQRRFGVGYYADSDFVHLDVGPVRRWSGH